MFARLQAEWRLKAGLTLLLSVVFWTAYGFLGGREVASPHVLPLTWLDRVIPFQPEAWAWVYLSQFALSGLVPWLIDTRAGLRRYVVGFAFLSGASFLLFWLFPVASPRPAELAYSGAMALIDRLDGALNAFPSLHAGFLAYLALLTWRLCGRAPGPLVFGLGVAWGAAILYATIATRQHYVVDLLAGGVLGGAADAVAWRGSGRDSVAATTRRQS